MLSILEMKVLKTSIKIVVPGFFALAGLAVNFNARYRVCFIANWLWACCIVQEKIYFMLLVYCVRNHISTFYFLSFCRRYFYNQCTLIIIRWASGFTLGGNQYYPLYSYQCQTFTIAEYHINAFSLNRCR